MSETSAGNGWAVPGATAEPDPRPPVAPGAGVPSLRRDDAAPGGRSARSLTPLGATGLLVEGPRSEASVPRLRLRPLTLADILDGAFGIVKARPARLLALTAIFVVPTTLLSAFLQRDALSTSGDWWQALLSDDEVNEDTAVSEGTTLWLTGADFVLSGLALVCVAAAVAYLMGRWSAGQDASLGELVGMVGRRWWALLASFVVVHLVEGIGLLACLVGAVFVMPLFVAVAPVIGAEGAGPIGALRRSIRLIKGRYWATLGVSTMIGVVALLLSLALGGAPAVLGLVLGFDVAWPLMAVAGVASSVVVTPFVAGATVLLYLDLRMRSEGLDLELTARDVFGEHAA